MKRLLTRRVDVPLYTQVATIIRGQIFDGEIRQGDRLPSEAELCDMFTVSRATVRQALDELERDNLIERAAGRGTFALAQPASSKAPARLRLSFSELQAQLEEHTQVHLNSGISVPPPSVETLLGLTKREECNFVIRVIKEGRSPWGAVKHYIRPEFANLLDSAVVEQGLPGALAAAAGRKHTVGSFWTEAIAAEPRFAMMLKIPIGSPILSIWWIDLFNGRPSVCSQMIAPGSNLALMGS
jgi:GntR family transcriptional regulator